MRRAPNPEALDALGATPEGFTDFVGLVDVAERAGLDPRDRSSYCHKPSNWQSLSPSGREWPVA